MWTTFRQKFHYALRGMAPGALFVLPVAGHACRQPGAVVGFPLAALALCALGSLVGFLGGAALDNVERCRLNPDGEYELALAVFWPVLAAATGMSFGGVPLVMLLQGSWLLATLAGFSGAFTGMVAMLWLESLRDPSEPSQTPRGGFLPWKVWAATWVVLAAIEAYVLWDLSHE